MPIYEYFCDSCDHKFEYIVLGNEDPRQCLLCGRSSIRRIISVCGLISRNKGSIPNTTSTNDSSSCGGCRASNCSGCK